LIDWKILHDEASFITRSVSNFGTRQKLTREREIEIKWVAEQIEMRVK
jgi:K+-sensing histidine kinase KdpD